jgi:hypothetical protein
MKGGRRAGVLLVLLLALSWSLIAFGSVRDVPSDSIREQSTKQFITNPGEHVGEQVIVDGTAAGTGPLVVQVNDQSVGAVSVDGIESERVSSGEQVYVFGRLTAPDRVEASRIVVEKRWETTSMYVVSALGILLVVALAARHWQVDWRQGLLVPDTEEPAPRDTATSARTEMENDG